MKSISVGVPLPRAKEAAWRVWAAQSLVASMVSPRCISANTVLLCGTRKTSLSKRSLVNIYNINTYRLQAYITSPMTNHVESLMIDP